MRMDQRDTGPESLQRVRNDLHAWDYHQEMCANLVFWLRIKMDPNRGSSIANQWSCFCLVKTWRLLHVYNHLGALVLPLGSTRNPGYTGYIAVGVQKCMWNTIKNFAFLLDGYAVRHSASTTFLWHISKRWLRVISTEIIWNPHDCKLQVPVSSWS